MERHLPSYDWNKYKKQKGLFSFHPEMIVYFKTEKRRNFYANIID
ncbi:aspartate aminotransferase, putative [Bacillus pumilus ATCC 7061]|nr:aspartate aminotransferase, putative [Bacillus pumilus ATCC 7061]